MILRTDRLVLREMTEDDLADLHAILGDPLAMVAYEGAFTPDESVAWLARNKRRYADDGYGLWAVDLPGAGMIGQCGITRQQIESDEVVEVGYRLGMTARRRFVEHYRGVDMPHIGFAADR